MDHGRFTQAPAAGLTPQESEQLSEYVSNDSYVQKQKKDVELLSQKYRNILDTGRDESKQEFIKEIKDGFVRSGEPVEAVFSIEMTDTGRTLVIEIKDKTEWQAAVKPIADEYASGELAAVYQSILEK